MFGSNKLNIFHFSPPWSISLPDCTDIVSFSISLLQSYSSNSHVMQFASFNIFTLRQKSHRTHCHILSETRSGNNNTSIHHSQQLPKYVFPNHFTITATMFASSPNLHKLQHLFSFSWCCAPRIITLVSLTHRQLTSLAQNNDMYTQP